MIQFKIQFKTKSKIFIQKNIHSIESRIFNRIIHSKKCGKLFKIPKWGQDMASLLISKVRGKLWQREGYIVKQSIPESQSMLKAQNKFKKFSKRPIQTVVRWRFNLFLSFRFCKLHWTLGAWDDIATGNCFRKEVLFIINDVWPRTFCSDEARMGGSFT